MSKAKIASANVVTENEGTSVQDNLGGADVNFSVQEELETNDRPLNVKSFRTDFTPDAETDPHKIFATLARLELDRGQLAFIQPNSW
ncbi:MAG: hypothetical protein NT091_00165, partial [Candidatus Falkowbacteria bacterium]|nr:hypothetical protein [Candidatus Falkowbacteria bacterium]